MSPKESDIQKSILDYLLMRGYFVWRNNTGAFGAESNGRKRWIRAGKKGAGDIIGLTKEGHFLSIEVKRRGQLPTDDQIRFIRSVLDNKGIAFVAHDLQDIIDKGF